MASSFVELPTPPTNIVITSRSTGIQVSWTASADWEDCITHYSVYITDSSGAISVTNTTNGGTSYTVDKPCSDVEIKVSGWSEGGEGERSSPKKCYGGTCTDWKLAALHYSKCHSHDHR